jgi:hypothetical protein
MKKLFICLFLLFSITLVLSVQAEAETKKEVIRMCYTDYPPMGSPDLPDGGFTTDLITSVFKRAGYEPTIKWLPWARCKNDAKALKYDIVLTMSDLIISKNKIGQCQI